MRNYGYYGCGITDIMDIVTEVRNIVPDVSTVLIRPGVYHIIIIILYVNYVNYGK